MPDTVETPTVLDGHAAEIWRAAFLSSYGGTCKDRGGERDSCAAAVAWTAVKDKYHKNDQDQWVAKMYHIGELPNTTTIQVVGNADAYRDGTIVVKDLFIDRRDYSDEERKKLAEEGKAMADGSYPIVTVEDLKNAIQAFGRSPDEATKRHILKRARELAATDELPPDWRGSTSEEKSMIELPGYEMRAHARKSANDVDWGVIRSAVGGQEAIRPDHISSERWNRLAAPLRTVGAVLFERICQRTYEQGVEDCVVAGWTPVPNPSRPEEFVFRRWLDHPQGRLLQRTVLVRHQGVPDWYLRELSRGASLSLAISTVPGEVRYRGPRLLLRGLPG